LKKQRFSPKNERACCMPGAKIGERPYLATPEPEFQTPIFGSFFVIPGLRFVVRLGVVVIL